MSTQYRWGGDGLADQRPMSWRPWPARATAALAASTNERRAGCRARSDVCDRHTDHGHWVASSARRSGGVENGRIDEVIAPSMVPQTEVFRRHDGADQGM